MLNRRELMRLGAAGFALLFRPKELKGAEEPLTDPKEIFEDLTGEKYPVGDGIANWPVVVEEAVEVFAVGVGIETKPDPIQKFVNPLITAIQLREYEEQPYIKFVFPLWKFHCEMHDHILIDYGTGIKKYKIAGMQRTTLHDGNVYPVGEAIRKC